MPKLCLYYDYLLTLLEDILHGSAVVVVVEDVVDEVVVDDVIVVKSVYYHVFIFHCSELHNF